MWAGGGLDYGWVAGNGPSEEGTRTEFAQRPAAGNYQKQIRTLGRLKEGAASLHSEIDWGRDSSIQGQ